MQAENFFFIIYILQKDMRPFIKSGYHIIPNYFLHLSLHGQKYWTIFGRPPYDYTFVIVPLILQYIYLQARAISIHTLFSSKA